MGNNVANHRSKWGKPWRKPTYEWGITWRTTDVYEDDGSDPAESVEAAAVHMRLAAHLAVELGEHLSDAQDAIAGQGHR